MRVFFRASTHPHVLLVLLLQVWPRIDLSEDYPIDLLDGMAPANVWWTLDPTLAEGLEEHWRGQLPELRRRLVEVVDTLPATQFVASRGSTESRAVSE